MTDNTENLILEHLRAIRSKLDQHSDEFRNVKLRLSSIETQMANVHSDLAILHGRIDGVEQRLDRIEKRLELTDA
jgi:tetrahydromethanopterin S-methyltransferase subunit G